MTNRNTVTGYLHAGYAQSLREFGLPCRLARCNGWVLQREIAGSGGLYDAMGCYPLLACQDWTQLDSDLREEGKKWVSICGVTDPFGKYRMSDLECCFDKVIPFKEHFVVEFDRPLERIVSNHHRYYSRRALQEVSVHLCDHPGDYLDDWVKLYANLVQMRGLRGIKAFSRAAFEMQLEVPGLVMFRAEREGVVVGAHLWYLQEDVSYSHLAASSPAGYRMMAAYALYWKSLEWLSERVHWVNLGAGSGTTGSADDGLSRMKHGWSTATRTAYFCSRIFSPEQYAMLVRRQQAGRNDYFPAYRQGEF